MNLFDNSFFDYWQDAIITFLSAKAMFSPLILITIEESGIPLFIPGDIVIAYFGYLISIGAISYPAAFLILLLAILSGSTILFFLSRRFGKLLVSKLGRLLHTDAKKLDIVEQKFEKYGPWVIIIGRHIPGFRIPITIFAGMSGMSYKTFIVSTFISVIFWIAFYLQIGEKLGMKTLHLFHTHYHVFFFLILLLLIVLIIYLLRTSHEETTKK